MPKRANWRSIKRHRNYTVEEASVALKICRGTVRRWIKNGLPALTDQRPKLILGDDLIEYLKRTNKPAQKCEAQQCYCFKCRKPRNPAFNMLEYHPFNATNGQLRALCAECSTVMNKGASQAGLARIRPEFSIEIRRADQRLNNGTDPPLNDHLKQDQ